VFLQAFVFISMGALADHGTRRKTFLMTFSFIGSISTILFASITSTAYRKFPLDLYFALYHFSIFDPQREPPSLTRLHYIQLSQK